MESTAPKKSNLIMDMAKAGVKHALPELPNSVKAIMVYIILSTLIGVSAQVWIIAKLIF